MAAAESLVTTVAAGKSTSRVASGLVCVTK
jgi:hypothetical protein